MIVDQLKIGTLNLCLGLKNKKDLVKCLLTENDMAILCMQETELKNDFDCNLVRIPGFVFEAENSDKKRVGCYIRDGIKYMRRNDLEKDNLHMLVIDIEGTNDKMKRIINVYRSFNPINCTARELFTKQLDIIKNAFNCDTLLVGDFHLEYNGLFFKI